MIVTTSRMHSNDLVNRTVEAFKPDYVAHVGGAGNKTLYVIEGKAHAYVFPTRGCKKWDTCAPEGILHSLGGRMTDILGNPLTYNKNENFTHELGILASYSTDEHAGYCQKIPSEVRERLFQSAKNRA